MAINDSGGWDVAGTKHTPIKWVERLALFSACLGGFMLATLALLTAISIIGRLLIPLGLSPVRGDFEYVEMGIAFVICAFLPWAHLKRQHADVRFVTDRFGPRFNVILDFVIDLLLLATALIITWRHAIGMAEKFGYGEVTFIVQMPLWWGYAGCLFGLCIWIIVAAAMSISNAVRLVKDESRGATAQ